MQPRIIVTGGNHVGKELPCHQPVIRFGSDPGCDLSLNDLDISPHTMTLEIGEGRCMVHPRGGSAIFLNGRAQTAGELFPWEDGVELQIGRKVRLRLEWPKAPPGKTGQEQATRPSPFPTAGPSGTAPKSAGAPSATDASDEAAAKAKRMQTQLAVILVCAALGAFFLLDPSMNPPKTASTRDQLETLIQQAWETKIPEFRQTTQALQDARTAELRGQTDRANELYLSARDSLLRWRAHGGAKATDWELEVDDKLTNYIGTQLQALPFVATIKVGGR